VKSNTEAKKVYQKSRKMFGFALN